MSLFRRDYSKPGPGVPKNLPPKKGIARFWEVLSGNFGTLVQLNLLMQLCYLPSQALFGFALYFFVAGKPLFWAFLFLALLGGVLVGPARAAESYIVTKMLRDDPGFLWHDFKKAFKANFKQGAVGGALFVAILGIQALAAVSIWATGSLPMMTLHGLGVVLFVVASPYFFAQLPYLELKIGPLLKNSMLLALAKAPRSLAGGLLAGLLMLGQALLFWWAPYIFGLTLLLGYTLPALVNLMWIWPVLDDTFRIDETLKQREAERTKEDAESMPG